MDTNKAMIAIRQLFREPDFLIHLENLCRAIPDCEAKLKGRKRLIEVWTQNAAANRELLTVRTHYDQPEYLLAQKSLGGPVYSMVRIT